MGQSANSRTGDHRGSFRIASVALTVVGGLGGGLIAGGVAAATSSHSAKRVVIATAKNKKLGSLLVSGTTLYTLKANKVACNAKCLQTWPPVTLPKGVTKAVAGTGVSGAKLGTVKTANGLLQVTYGGKALYWFAKDKAAGQVNGNVKDTWGTWSDVVTAKPTSSRSGASTTTTPSGNGGTGGVAF